MEKSSKENSDQEMSGTVEENNPAQKSSSFASLFGFFGQGNVNENTTNKTEESYLLAGEP